MQLKFFLNYHIGLRAKDNAGNWGSYSSCQNFTVSACKGKGESCSSDNDCCGYTGNAGGDFCLGNPGDKHCTGTEDCTSLGYNLWDPSTCNSDISSCIKTSTTPWMACCSLSSLGMGNGQGGIFDPIEIIH